MSWDQFLHGNLQLPYRLHATSHGDSNKPVVVLLHGIAASGEGWGELIPLLTPYYRCVTIDLLGFGRSPKPQWANYDMGQHERSIRYTIRALHISGDFTLVGHSLGSFIATNYVSRHPRHIKRLILLSPPVYPPLNTIAGRIALKRTDLLMRAYRAIREHPRMNSANIGRLAKIGILPQSIITHTDTWIPFKRSLENCVEQQTVSSDIAHIQIPIDVFYGTLDAVVVGENVRSLSRMRDVELHSFRGNHQLNKTYAKVVARLLTNRL